MRALACLIAVALFACAPPAPPPAPAGEPALWRITDSDSEIWLFGTVHVLPPELEWRNARIDAALAAAEELVVETDAENAEATNALTARYGLQPEGQRLSDALDAPARERLARVSRSLGVDPASLEPLRPWLAALRLSFTYAVREGHQQQAGVETVLLAEARAQGKTITYLETPEQQIRTLADLSPEDQLRFLAASLDQIENQDETLERMDRAWVSGDVAALDEQMRTQLNEAGGAAYDAIITRRNAAWVEEIARRLDGSGRIFYAVGSAHLVGENGVVARLRARGIEVEGP